MSVTCVIVTLCVASWICICFVYVCCRLFGNSRLFLPCVVCTAHVALLLLVLLLIIVRVQVGIVRLSFDVHSVLDCARAHFVSAVSLCHL